MAEPRDLLVSTEWLGKHLNDPEVRVVDMRGYVVTRLVEPGVEEAEYRGAPEEYRCRSYPRGSLHRLDERHHRPR